MKFIMQSVLCVVVLAFWGVLQASAEGWLTDVAEAKRVAAEKQMPIVVNFSGSDWCGWCIKLGKEVFSQEAFLAYAKDNVVLLEADFPRRTQQDKAVAAQNKALAGKYGIQGFPTVIIIDATGKEIARTGYRRGGPESYVKHLKELIAKK